MAHHCIFRSVLDSGAWAALTLLEFDPMLNVSFKSNAVIYSCSWPFLFRRGSRGISQVGRAVSLWGVVVSGDKVFDAISIHIPWNSQDWCFKLLDFPSLTLLVNDTEVDFSPNTVVPFSVSLTFSGRWSQQLSELHYVNVTYSWSKAVFHYLVVILSTLSPPN